MRIALFTSGGEFGALALAALAAEHEIATVVRPISPASIPRRLIGQAARILRLRRRDPVARLTRTLRTPVLCVGRQHAESIRGALGLVKPDIICIATFPWLLKPELLTLARHGAVNLHPSLLPRHRGPNPYFWVYYHDDRDAGVTIHQVTARADAGPILAQEAFALPRGMSIEQLYQTTARTGSSLLRHVVTAIERGSARGAAQSDDHATQAPRVAAGAAMVAFDHWNVERVWHFLAGVFPKFREPLRCSGRRIAYHAVLGFVPAETEAQLGALTRAPYGWDLHCRGGYVRLRSRWGVK